MPFIVIIFMATLGVREVTYRAIKHHQAVNHIVTKAPSIPVVPGLGEK